MNPNKLTVVKLRQELQKRGLDTKGTKPVLVERLQEALDQGNGSEDNEDNEEGGGDTSQEFFDANASQTSLTESFSTAADITKEDMDTSKQEEVIKDEPENTKKEKTPISESKPTKAKTEETKPTKAKTEETKPSKAKTEEKPANDVKPEVDEVTEVKRDHSERRSEKRKHSPDRKRSRSPKAKSPVKEKKQEEIPVEVFDETLVTLDVYDSDLNLVIDKSRYSAKPLTDEGFAFVWAGARACYGYKKGKICFEVKIEKHLEVGHLPADEPSPHVVRVGWSTTDTTMQLGEEPRSYGYGGTAKISTSCQFKDYGTEFIEGDVVGCYINMDVDPILISYSRNGADQGIAFRVYRADIGDKALFPHILTKNSSFQVNLGQMEAPLFGHPPGYEEFKFCQCVPLEERERGPLAPTKKQECEMIMMCGLPGCGKTTWANEYVAKNPSKKYNILGTNNLIDKMKVMGLPRRRNYSGRWDVLIQQCTKCLNTLLTSGSKTCRNYILDQTNVYPSAQRRKMRPFEGFKRRAVVLVPTDEEFRRRCDKRESEEGKDIPDSAVLEMKANFKLPEVGQVFEEVEYVEVEADEASKLVIGYNKEGKDALPNQEKRFRNNDRGGRPRWDDVRDRDRYGGGDTGGRGDFHSRVERGYRGGGGGGGGGRYGSPGGGRGRFERSWSGDRGDRGDRDRDRGRNGYDRRPPPRGPPGGGRGWGSGEGGGYGARGGGGSYGGRSGGRDGGYSRYEQSSSHGYGSSGGASSYGQGGYSSYQGQSTGSYGYGQQSGYGAHAGYGQQAYAKSSAGYGQQAYGQQAASSYGQQASGYGTAASQYSQQPASQTYGYGQTYQQWPQQQWPQQPATAATTAAQQQYYNQYYSQYYSQQAAAAATPQAYAAPK